MSRGALRGGKPSSLGSGGDGDGSVKPTGLSLYYGRPRPIKYAHKHPGNGPVIVTKARKERS